MQMFVLRMTREDRQLLDQLARRHDRSAAAMVRHLIRHAAQSTQPAHSKEIQQRPTDVFQNV